MDGRDINPNRQRGQLGRLKNPLGSGE